MGQFSGQFSVMNIEPVCVHPKPGREPEGEMVTYLEI